MEYKNFISVELIVVCPGVWSHATTWTTGPAHRECGLNMDNAKPPASGLDCFVPMILDT